MDIFDYAIKMEQTGKAYYLKLAETATIPGLRTIFTWLAEDEQKHCDIFLAWQRGSQDVAMKSSTVLEDAKGVFSAQPRYTGTHLKGDLEGYRYAMGLEAESFRLYESAAKAAEADAERELLLKIAGEERKHFQILENIYAFINAPNQYLAWGEFSNLEEFRNFGRNVDT